MSASTRTLLVNAEVYSSSDPFATALMIDDGVITWVGDDAGARVHTDLAHRVVDLEGAFVAPGFVDSHVHATSTGLRLVGLDLSDTRSAQDVLDAVQRRAMESTTGFIYGHGWDETMWSDPRLPSRSQIDQAAPGQHVYMSRIDVHSALVSTSLVDRCRGVDGVAGFSSEGAVSQSAHHLIRELAFEQISTRDRREAQLATLSLAASRGVVALHEMGGPTIGGAEDLRTLLELAVDKAGPKVEGYWGQLASEGGIEQARELGASAVGGDLFVDGSLGSHSAALDRPYCDAADTRGVLYLSEDDIADHLVEATRAGFQAGFHVIGDAACAAVAAGFRRAADIVGEQMLRARRHRLEHAEMLSDADIATVINLGACVSMQPIFDALWGVPDGMYATRLGHERAGSMNRFATIVAAGGHLVLNSDSPVTPIDPWSIVRAATNHTVPDERLTARAAFAAATRGGWRAIGDSRAGVISVGAPAHLAAWRVAERDVHVPDTRVAGWSTDPRSGTPGLPVLTGDLPECLATWVHGRVVFGDEIVEADSG